MARCRRGGDRRLVGRVGRRRPPPSRRCPLRLRRRAGKGASAPRRGGRGRAWRRRAGRRRARRGRAVPLPAAARDGLGQALLAAAPRSPRARRFVLVVNDRLQLDQQLFDAARRFLANGAPGSALRGAAALSDVFRAHAGARRRAAATTRRDRRVRDAAEVPARRRARGAGAPAAPRGLVAVIVDEAHRSTAAAGFRSGQRAPGMRRRRGADVIIGPRRRRVRPRRPLRRVERGRRARRRRRRRARRRRSTHAVPSRDRVVADGAALPQGATTQLPPRARLRAERRRRRARRRRRGRRRGARTRARARGAHHGPCSAKGRRAAELRARSPCRIDAAASAAASRGSGRRCSSCARACTSPSTRGCCARRLRAAPMTTTPTPPTPPRRPDPKAQGAAAAAPLQRVLGRAAGTRRARAQRGRHTLDAATFIVSQQARDGLRRAAARSVSPTRPAGAPLSGGSRTASGAQRGRCASSFANDAPRVRDAFAAFWGACATDDAAGARAAATSGCARRRARRATSGCSTCSRSRPRATGDAARPPSTSGARRGGRAARRAARRRRRARGEDAAEIAALRRAAEARSPARARRSCATRSPRPTKAARPTGPRPRAAAAPPPRPTTTTTTTTVTAARTGRRSRRRARWPPPAACGGRRTDRPRRCAA